MEAMTVEEYEARLIEWKKRTYGDEVLSFPFLIGIIQAIVDLPGPADRKVEEVKNVLTAFDRLRSGKKSAGRDPQPAA